MHVAICIMKELVMQQAPLNVLHAAAAARTRDNIGNSSYFSQYRRRGRRNLRIYIYIYIYIYYCIMKELVMQQASVRFGALKFATSEMVIVFFPISTQGTSQSADVYILYVNMIDLHGS